MLTVQKFGGSSLADAERLRRAARLAARARREGALIVVVSAMGDSTDDLLALARTLSPEPPPRELDALLSTGERCSAALLAITLESIGCPARSLSGPQAGICAEGEHGDGRIVLLTPRRLLETLEEGRVAVVCGFQGRNAEGDVITLGRGGSDTSAVTLAAALGAGRCEIYSDVEGVYTADPRLLPEARFQPLIDTEDMLRLAEAGAQVLHPRAARAALEGGLELTLRSSFTDGGGTVVRRLPEALRPPYAGVTRRSGGSTVTLVGRAADAAALAGLADALTEAGIPVLSRRLDPGSVSVGVPEARQIEALGLAHRLFLEEKES